MIEYHVPMELLDRMYKVCPDDWIMSYYIKSILEPLNARCKDGMYFTFIFEREQDLTAFLLKHG